MGAAPAATMTHKYTVRLAVFDEDDGCACTLGATQTWFDSYGALDGCGTDTHCYAVNDWVSATAGWSDPVCGQITAVNATASSDATIDMGSSYSDCAGCNDYTSQCFDMGGGPGGP
jgi:hypothetical protein